MYFFSILSASTSNQDGVGGKITARLCSRFTFEVFSFFFFAVEVATADLRTGAHAVCRRETVASPFLSMQKMVSILLKVIKINRKRKRTKKNRMQRKSVGAGILGRRRLRPRWRFVRSLQRASASIDVIDVLFVFVFCSLQIAVGPSVETRTLRRRWLSYRSSSRSIAVRSSNERRDTITAHHNLAEPP